jgi:hypothetical protein
MVGPLPTSSIRRQALCAALLLSGSAPLAAQGQPEKEINEQTQVWLSVNSTSRFTDRWGAVGDFHIRRNDFLRDPSFYFLRFGAHYWLTEAVAVTLGYAHNWVAPAHEEWNTWTQENRIYQQVQYATNVGKVRVLHRLRNEQRWQQEVVDDALTGEDRFSDRVRYLVSLTIPVSGKPSVPSLVVSDEILVQFGPEIVANTFDQNRLFLGIKKGLGRTWSFDLGYMLVYQEKASGYQYDLNHTLRWFFYFNPDFRKIKATYDSAGGEE